MTKILTTKQRQFLTTREVEENKLYMFPMFGFHFYADENRNEGEILTTNPLGKSLAGQSFYSKQVLENGLVRGNFYQNPIKDDFFMERFELEKRDKIEVVLMSLFYVPFCFVKNIFRREND